MCTMRLTIFYAVLTMINVGELSSKDKHVHNYGKHIVITDINKVTIKWNSVRIASKGETTVYINKQEYSNIQRRRQWSWTLTQHNINGKNTIVLNEMQTECTV